MTTADVLALPTLDAVLDSAVAFRVSLKVPFRNTTERVGLLLEGPAGWGEFAPFADYDAAAATAWLAAAVEAAWIGWPEPVRDWVAVNGIVPDLNAAQSAQFAADAVGRGVRTLKVKVAGPGVKPVTDLMRLEAIREAVGSDIHIRIDANGGWSTDEALIVLEAIGGDAIEYVEQPCATLAECAVVKASNVVKVAIDEGLRRAQDVDDSELHDQIRRAADVLVIKSAPLGGVRRAMRVAHAIGLPTVVSGAMDTSVGLAAGVALAAALPGSSRAGGLGTGALLATDVVTNTELPEAGRLAVRAIAPDAAPLAAARALVARADNEAMRARLTAAWNAGAMRLLEGALS